MLVEQFYNDDYAVLRTGNLHFYFGYEVTDPKTEEWCFEVERDEKVIFHATASEINAVDDDGMEYDTPADYLAFGIGMWLATLQATSKSPTPEPGTVHHWLYGDKEYKVLVKEDTKCNLCIHREVCNHDTSKRCSNYTFSCSGVTGCESCILHFAKYDTKQPIPCFHCKWFEPIMKIDKKLYSEIEDLIIRWTIDGTKTGGSLTRQIMELL